ncbi:polycomb protein Sfmbt isoform X2 [Bacillus rossius redtenbacheri]|uniref:polycomb protein Sfmbt isoform X2 n=1 Tax=Bacillus rossius redtenbacheri TaxID=93214 RepID=UPI002FDDD956
MEMATDDDPSSLWLSGMLQFNDSNSMLLQQGQQDPDFCSMAEDSFDTPGRLKVEMGGYMMLEEYDQFGEEMPQVVASPAQAALTPPDAGYSASMDELMNNSNRKIRPIFHPALKLQTPIAYQKDTDPSVIPILKEGMAVCAHCGAIGVKHAFYTKERRFCSLLCSREFQEIERLKAKQQTTNRDVADNGDITMKELMGSEPMASPESASMPTQYILPLPGMDEPPLSPPGKRNRSDVYKNNAWSKEVLSEVGFVATPVSCFKHAPISEIWDNITVGMKVEVESKDCDDVSETSRDSFWVATVLKVAGYYALLRYEGFDQNDSKDFWVNLGTSSVHPVGWCATRGKPLIPPKSIEAKYKDWKEFLVERLTGARTLPTNYFHKVNESMQSRFSQGMMLEAMDKDQINQVKVATIHKIVGKRLNLKYWDLPVHAGFWCHEDSCLIHPVGWALRVGHEISAPPEYLERCAGGKSPSEAAPKELFRVPPNHHTPPSVDFKEGMMLETMDPLNPSSICVATVKKVLKEGYLMIRVDSFEPYANRGDWFCFHKSSPLLFPAGYCDVNNIPLCPPLSHAHQEFCWESYLQETNASTAPLELFTRDFPAHGFVEGMRLEAAEVMEPGRICVATVMRVAGRMIKIHFDGWDDEFDQWLDHESPDMYPVGWCQLVGHRLEPARQPDEDRATSKTPKGVKKKPRKQKKGKGLPLHSAGSGAKKATQGQGAQAAKPSNGNDRSPREPAQATKLTPDIHHLQAGGEVVPEGSGVVGREPEMGQEPSGPDQSLPVSTEPNQPPIPRERPASSYISMPATSSKCIPRLVDSTGYCGEPGDLVPSEWNVFDVAQFLRVNDCAAYCDNFSKKKIDGNALLALTKDEIIDLVGMKVGPSVKIYDLIQQLKIKVNPAKERMKASFSKKIL